MLFAAVERGVSQAKRVEERNHGVQLLLKSLEVGLARRPWKSGEAAKAECEPQWITISFSILDMHSKARTSKSTYVSMAKGGATRVEREAEGAKAEAAPRSKAMTSPRMGAKKIASRRLSQQHVSSHKFLKFSEP